MNNKIKVLAGLTALGSTAFINHASATPQIFTGSVVADGPYGNIQVQITVDGGLITAITTPVQPTGQSAAYASFAIPTLVTEALAAQSANINAVSGASYISSAWKSSLASAIANAGSAIGIQSSPAPTTSAPTPTLTTTFTPVTSVSGNTVCTTQAPTPVSTTTSTTTTTISDPTPSTVPTSIPSSTPTVAPTPTLPEPSESETRSTPTPTSTRTSTSTPTPTFRPTESGESEGGANLIARTVTTSGNLTTTITITKVITQNQIVNCTTTNTVTNTVNVPVPGPTVTVTPVPVDTPVPPIIIGPPDHPIIHKTPSPKPKPVIKKKIKYNPYSISVIKCQSGKYIKVIAAPQPVCPRGYVKVK